MVNDAGREFTVSCALSSLSAKVETVVWKKDDTDVTTLSDGNTYIPDIGGASFDVDTQTTTLEVSTPDATHGTTLVFTCVVTDPSDGVTTEEETVDLVFYSECRTYKIR